MNQYQLDVYSYKKYAQSYKKLNRYISHTTSQNISQKSL